MLSVIAPGSLGWPLLLARDGPDRAMTEMAELSAKGEGVAAVAAPVAQAMFEVMLRTE